MKTLPYIAAFLLAFLLVLPSYGSHRQVDTTGVKNEECLKKARYVTAKAKDEIGLTEAEAEFLEEAFYFRYNEGVKRTEGVTDTAKISEIKSDIHKEFSSLVYEHYGRERSAEIIAWYYNYSNRKR